MKRYLCPVLSIGFYVLYFILLQGAVYILPETSLTPFIVIAAVFLIIPVIASKTSAVVMSKIKGASCQI